MEHMMKQCKSCCKDITEEEAEECIGYCKSCYADYINIENIVAKKIKDISIWIGLLGVVMAIIILVNENIIGSIIIGLISVLIAILVYGYGEIIQLLEDIKNR